MICDRMTKASPLQGLAEGASQNVLLHEGYDRRWSTVRRVDRGSMPTRRTGLPPPLEKKSKGVP